MFQRTREKWITEFAQYITDSVKNINKEITVEHNVSHLLSSWIQSLPSQITYANDFLQGDYYGSYVQGSAVCKLYYNTSKNLPFGFETSSNVSIKNHTCLKHPEQLKQKALMAVANGGAFVFIDGIDPAGTLNPNVYTTMGSVFDEVLPYDGYISGRMCQDVGIYLSTESKFSFEDNGKDVLDQLSDKFPHLEGIFCIADSLIKHHIPFGIVTKNNLDMIGKYKAIVLSNVLMLSHDEAKAIKSYVKSGGKLLTTGYTSLTDTCGEKQDNFILN